MRVIASSSDQFHELNERHSPTAFSSYILGMALNNDSDEDDADNQFLQSEEGHSSVV